MRGKAEMNSTYNSIKQDSTMNILQQNITKVLQEQYELDYQFFYNLTESSSKNIDDEKTAVTISIDPVFKQGWIIGVNSAYASIMKEMPQLIEEWLNVGTEKDVERLKIENGKKDVKIENIERNIEEIKLKVDLLPSMQSDIRQIKDAIDGYKTAKSFFLQHLLSPIISAVVVGLIFKFGHI